MRDAKIKISYVLTPRDKLGESITVEEFFKGIKSGRWRDVTEKARALKTSTRYDKYKLKSVPGVWLHELPLMCFDWEEDDVSIPTKYILAKFRSVGGSGWAVVVKLPDGLRTDEWRDSRKAIQAQHGIVSNERQIANDRPRFVSYDPDIVVNWSALPFPAVQVQKAEHIQSGSHGEGAQLYVAAKTGLQFLDNDTALSVFSYLRNSAYSFEETVEILESLPFKSRTLATKKSRARYYEKWERQYGDNYPLARVVIHAKKLKPAEEPKKKSEPVVLNIEEPADNTISDEEQIRLTIGSVLAPYLPIDINYFGKLMPATTSTVFVGSPSSGKGYINTAIEALDDITEEIEEQLYQWRIDYYTGLVSINGKEIHTPVDEKKAHRLMPNLSLKWGFQGTEAALLGMLSEVPTVLIHASDFASAIAGMGKDFNSGLIATLLQLTEGEIIDKVNKKQEIYGKTKFKLKNYRAGMVVGGTPDDVVRIFSKNLNNGLVSRILFAVLRESNSDKTMLMKQPKLDKHVSPELIFKTITGDQALIQATYDEDWTDKLKAELMEEYEGPLRHCVRRGVRDAIKRAAVEAWLDGERKSFKLSRKDIEKQMEYFYKSQKFVETFQDYETDRWGQNNISQKIKEGKDLVYGKAIEVKSGVRISDKEAKAVLEVYQELKGNATATARAFGISRQTLYRMLKRNI